jgi:hypothetical protein
VHHIIQKKTGLRPWKEIMIIEKPKEEMENKLLTDFEISRVQGGMPAFEKTGDYTDNLHFYSGFYNHNWTAKCQTDELTGTLILDDLVVFEYVFKGMKCRIRAKMVDGTFSDWLDVDVVHILAD